MSLKEGHHLASHNVLKDFLITIESDRTNFLDCICLIFVILSTLRSFPLKSCRGVEKSLKEGGRMARDRSSHLLDIYLHEDNDIYIVTVNRPHYGL